MNRKQIEAIKSTIHALEERKEAADLTAELREAFPKLAAELDHENQTLDIIANAATEAGLRRGPKVVAPAEGDGFAVLADYYARTPRCARCNGTRWLVNQRLGDTQEVPCPECNSTALTSSR